MIILDKGIVPLMILFFVLISTSISPLRFEVAKAIDRSPFPILAVKPSLTRTIIVPDDYPTISLAVNASNTGDTVFVRSGTYEDSVAIQKAISLVGENLQNTTVFGGDGKAVIKILSNGVNVTGLTAGYAGNGYEAAGINLINASRCKISENVITGSRFGVWLHASSDNEISRNNITSNTQYGVWLDNSSNNSLIENRLTENFCGLQFDNSSYNRLRDNHISSQVSNIGIHGSGLTDFFNDVDPSNTVGGQPICYLVNKQHEVVPTNAGYVVVVNSTDITIENLNIGGNEQGILLVKVENSTITGNYIRYNAYGICSVLSSNNNSIVRNAFRYNNQHTIAFVSSSNNSVYLNNFIQHSNTVYNSPDSINIWDNGTHGNCWIFSALIDDTQVNVTLATLLNATEVNSSGIWNTSYMIDGNNIDHYPLVNQVTIPEFPSLTILLILMTTALAVEFVFTRKKRTSSRSTSF